MRAATVSAPRLVGFCFLAMLPAGLAAQEPLYDMLVSSRNTASVKRFDGATGAYIDDFIGPGSGGLGLTQEVLVAPNGDLIVSGRSNSQILRYDYRTGKYLGPFTSGYVLDGPTKMTWGPDGNLYVSQWGSTRETVAVFGPDGSYLREATPRLDDPMQHAWDTDGSLLVVYWASRDVRRFDENGQLVEVFVSDSRLQGPVNLSWDENHDLLVYDWQSGSVYRYDGESGSYMDTYIGALRSPEGWAIGPDGLLYVAEWAGNAVKRFDRSSGTLIDTFAQGNGLGAPNSVLFVERPSTFSLTPAVSQVEVDAGSSEALTIEVAGVRGVPFESAVSVTCTAPSPAVQCSPSPATVTPGEGATVTVTVSASAANAASAGAWMGFFVLAGLAAAVFAGGRRRTAGVAAACLGLVFACGGDSTGPDTAVDTTIQVVGAADGLTASTTVAVRVR